MGWLNMQTLGGHSGPRQYLDAQFTHENNGSRAQVLRSSLVKMRTWYAAVEVHRPDRPREVVCVVCLVRYNPRDREGYVFGYKDMDETMGPCEADCPAAILDLLTPTDNEHANTWRARCRANLAARAAKPKLRHGQIVSFEQPLRFTDGSSFERMQVVIEPSRPRAVRFRPVGGYGLYRIGRLDALAFRVEPAPR